MRRRSVKLRIDLGATKKMEGLGGESLVWKHSDVAYHAGAMVVEAVEFVDTWNRDYAQVAYGPEITWRRIQGSIVAISGGTCTSVRLLRVAGD